MIDNDYARYEYMGNRMCQMTDAIYELICDIDKITPKYFGKLTTLSIRSELENEIWTAINNVQNKYPDVCQEFDNIRFMVVEYERGKLQLMPCNLLTHLIFQHLCTIS